MKIELTDKFESFLKKNFPCIEVAEEAIFEATGVTIEQIRSNDRLSHYVFARAIFWNLCIPHVQRSVYLASYINRDHATGSRYGSEYYEMHKYDYIFQRMVEDTKRLFDKKMKDGYI